ncbi:MAG: ribonuclease H-like domain-containing protein [Acidobacteriota bacterium]
MIRNTFCHIPGVGLRKEAHIWSLGIHSWDHIDTDALPFGKKRALTFKEQIGESVERLHAGDCAYFYGSLPSDQQWRLFGEFRGKTAYLDIETTGMGYPSDHITTIALYDGKRIRHYVHGVNLNDFPKDIARYDLLVTYNGKSFDIPMIRQQFRIAMNHAHIDLRYVLRSLGYSGGLKGCEKQLGLDREELDGVDGFFAVLLWQDYKRRGNRAALDTLLAYNIMDTVNLETLMVIAYNMKLQRQTLFAGTHVLQLPEQPEIPFSADLGTIERIRPQTAAFPSYR